MKRLLVVAALIATLAACATAPSGAARDPLPSWNSGGARSAVVEFVARVSDIGSPDFVAPADRIAVFDNDGTLIIERPAVVQFEFLYSRIRAEAPEHPDWADQEPFAAVLRNDRAALAALSFAETGAIVAQGQANLFQNDFATAARAFLDTAKHPRFDVRYIELVYQPMLEFIDFLKANGFSVYVVSGGGIEFIREFSEPAYRIARDHVIGSSMKISLIDRDGRVSIWRKPGWQSLNVGPIKATNIQLHVGRRPIVAVGNSDGDLDMLRFAHDGSLPSLVMLLDHDDPDREYAYDDAPNAREAAGLYGWSVISMREDFRIVFPDKP
ncbi:MAG: haloacid dehalogenase-like hydrolase [Gammaproteobacteria bacterium]|nr:haloacid dehalogenase-like hydrolase [Gammaproteobacteria bacterium]